MYKKYLGIVVLLYSGLNYSWSKTLFSSQRLLLRELIHLIDKESGRYGEIHFSVYALSHPLVAAKLIQAKKRGVVVQGVISQLEDTSKFDVLRKHGIDVASSNSICSHHKICCFLANGPQQEPVVWMGSANFSVSGLEGYNRESVEIFGDDEQRYEAYRKQCEQDFYDCICWSYTTRKR